MKYMRSTLLILSIFLFAIALMSFIREDEISKCFLTYRGPKGLTMQTPERLPETSDKFRELKTTYGDIKITRIDGYRVLYVNEKKAPFVNLKVELSDAKYYSTDTIGLINNLNWLSSVSAGLKTKGIIDTTFNGYKIYGVSR